MEDDVVDNDLLVVFFQKEPSSVSGKNPSSRMNVLYPSLFSFGECKELICHRIDLDGSVFQHPLTEHSVVFLEELIYLVFVVKLFWL